MNFEFEYIVQKSNYTYVRVQGHEMLTFQQISRINTTKINNEEHHFQRLFEDHWVILFQFGSRRVWIASSR